MPTTPSSRFIHTKIRTVTKTSCEDEGSDTRGTGSWERETRIISAVSGPSGVHAITPKLLIFPLSTCES
ncbi:Uncharacterized protein FWK35_00021018 [Aphis craccivora]|uniref:Uncharacterized protein n=1 Tax=Aphis craccivora TaxID=307492 RepID=A0A6G0Z6P3_APHCR|nr:Uncharacterized protein FWK35_00021018 [Aphis craccivora]